MFKVGFGQDSHPFTQDPDKPLILGGVEIPGGNGFAGNSDGDVIIHALCNALEQAIGGNSLSLYSDPMCQQGITDSREYLKVAMQHVLEKGYLVNNAGISVEAIRPKITHIANQMRTVLAPLLGISEEAIGINATTGEGMTPFGKGEGVQAFAIVSLIKKQ